MLVGWGFNKTAVRVHEESLTMTVGSGTVLSVAAGLSAEVQFEWIDQTWAQWQEMQESTEY